MLVGTTELTVFPWASVRPGVLAIAIEYSALPSTPTKPLHKGEVGPIPIIPKVAS